MPQRRSPKTLRDVSHLFLSAGKAQAQPARAESSAAVWLAVTSRDENRAFLAAGVAAALAGQGFSVTLAEIVTGLPTVGYYFGLEPAEHLAPIADRRTPLAGEWGDSIRFFSACDPAFLPLIGPQIRRDGRPSALVAAFDAAGDSIHPPFFDELRERLAAAAGGGSREGALPDCLAVVSRDARSGAAFADSVNGIAPVPVMLVAAPAGAASRGEPLPGETAGRAVGRLAIPRSLRVSWARRVPPADTFFHDLASMALQQLSLERRRVSRGPARG